MRVFLLQTIFLLLSFVIFAPCQDNKPISVFPEGFDFRGNWICAGAFGNGKVHRSTFAGTVVLDGKWLELSETDVEPATGYVAKYLIGYDVQQKRLIEFDANNFGAATYSSNDGWFNNVLTMTSPITTQDSSYAANRFLYTVEDANTFTVDWQISKTANLKWLPSDHLVCHREAAK
jgi:hypothetical protein